MGAVETSGTAPMPGDILLEVRHKEALGVRGVVERWRAAPGFDITAEEAHRLVLAVQRYPERLREILEEELGHVVETPGITPPQALRIREVVEQVADSYVALAELARDLVKPAVREGDERARLLAGVQGALEKLGGLRREVAERWPVGNAAELAEARAAAARGEAVPLDEAFAELAGVSKEEWRRLVEGRRPTGKDLGLE
jgi:hypothetical protein